MILINHDGSKATITTTTALVLLESMTYQLPWSSTGTVHCAAVVAACDR